MHKNICILIILMKLIHFMGRKMQTKWSLQMDIEKQKHFYLISNFNVNLLFKEHIVTTFLWSRQNISLCFSSSSSTSQLSLSFV